MFGSVWVGCVFDVFFHSRFQSSTGHWIVHIMFRLWQTVKSKKDNNTHNRIVQCSVQRNKRGTQSVPFHSTHDRLRPLINITEQSHTHHGKYCLTAAIGQHVTEYDENDEKRLPQHPAQLVGKGLYHPPKHQESTEP